MISHYNEKDFDKPESLAGQKVGGRAPAPGDANENERRKGDELRAKYVDMALTLISLQGESLRSSPRMHRKRA